MILLQWGILCFYHIYIVMKSNLIGIFQLPWWLFLELLFDFMPAHEIQSDSQWLCILLWCDDNYDVNSVFFSCKTE